MSGSFPTLQEVKAATQEELCRWYRFLPSAMTEADLKIQSCIYDRWYAGGGFTPEISKRIGWNE